MIGFPVGAIGSLDQFLTTPWYMGVDPGKGGAMAMYSHDESGEKLHVYDFVTVKGESSLNQFYGRDSKTQIAITETADIIRTFEDVYGKIKLVLLEEPNSMPNDGHVGAFNFGKACGILDGIFGTLGLKVIPIRPAVWKSQLALSANKQKSIDKALDVFKNIEGAHKYFELKKHNDRAEAALLAWHCRRKFGGKLP